MARYQCAMKREIPEHSPMQELFQVADELAARRHSVQACDAALPVISCRNRDLHVQISGSHG